jgi:hypothetical protein
VNEFAFEMKPEMARWPAAELAAHGAAVAVNHVGDSSVAHATGEAAEA